MTNYPLGKAPAREGAIKFKIDRYLDTSKLPAAPAVFSHANLVSDWGMLGNDRYGDCVFAGADHETLLWNAEVGATVRFTDVTALADYAAVTGFNPNDPSTDQGTDMEEAAKYRRKTGILDADGKRHTVGAYVTLPGVSARGDNSPSIIDSLASVAYLFGAVGIGIEFPDSAMAQFNAGQPWEIVPNSPIEGGHYVPLIGRTAGGNFQVLTWGRVQEVTPSFLLKYVDEAIVYLSTEFLNGQGVSIDGFDLTALNADIQALGGQPVPAPAPPAPPAPTPQPTPTPAPTPAPVPVSAPFPIREVVPWLETWPTTRKANRAQKALIGWLHETGQL